MNEGEVEEGEVVSSDEEDLGQKPGSDKGVHTAEADAKASEKSVKRSAPLSHANDDPPRKEVKLIEEDVSDEGEIFSDDEEAAYYPKIVKSRDNSKQLSSGKISDNKQTTEDDSSGNSSSGPYDHDLGRKDYLQDSLEQDRGGLHASDDSRYSSHDSRTRRRGRWTKEQQQQQGWTSDGSGHRSKSGGAPHHRHGSRQESGGRLGGARNILPRLMSAYQMACVAATVKERRDRGEALMATPKGATCNNLDQFNYPAPPSWYIEALEAYEEKEKERELKSGGEPAVPGDQQGAPELIAAVVVPVTRPDSLRIELDPKANAAPPKETLQVVENSNKVSRVGEDTHSPKDVVASSAGNGDESDDDYDRYLDQLDEEEEEIEDSAPDIGSVVTALNEEFPQLNPSQPPLSLGKMAGTFPEEHQSLQLLLKQCIGDESEGNGPVQRDAPPSKQVGKKKGKGGGGKAKDAQKERVAEVSKSKPRLPCRFFRNGLCKNGDNCTYSHDVEREKKKEICKFYLQESCTKGDDCLYYHGSFPCKFHHTNNGCYQGDKCRFSHDPLTSETYELLLTVLDPNSRDPTKLPQFPGGEKQPDSSYSPPVPGNAIGEVAPNGGEKVTSAPGRKQGSQKRQWWESAGEATASEPTAQQQKGSGGGLVVSILLSALRKDLFSKGGDGKEPLAKVAKVVSVATGSDSRGPIPLFPPGSLPLSRPSVHQLALHPEAAGGGGSGEGGEGGRVPGRVLLPTPPAHMQLSPEELMKMEEMEPIVWVAPGMAQSFADEENCLNGKGYQSPSRHESGPPGWNGGGDMADHVGMNGGFDLRPPWPARDLRLSQVTSQEPGVDQGRSVVDVSGPSFHSPGLPNHLAPPDLYPPPPFPPMLHGRFPPDPRMSLDHHRPPLPDLRLPPPPEPRLSMDPRLPPDLRLLSDLRGPLDPRLPPMPLDPRLLPDLRFLGDQRLHTDPRLPLDLRLPPDPRLQVDPRQPPDPRLQVDPRQPPDPRLQVDPRQPPDPRLQLDPRQPPDPRLQVDPRQPPDPRLQMDPRLPPDPRLQVDPRLPPDPRLQVDPRLPPDPRLQADPRQPPDLRLQVDPRQPPDPRLQVDPRQPPDLRLQVDPRQPPDLRLQVDPRQPPDPRLQADPRLQVDSRLPPDPRLQADLRLPPDPRLQADPRMPQDSRLALDPRFSQDVRDVRSTPTQDPRFLPDPFVPPFAPTYQTSRSLDTESSIPPPSSSSDSSFFHEQHFSNPYREPQSVLSTASDLHRQVDTPSPRSTQEIPAPPQTELFKRGVGSMSDQFKTSGQDPTKNDPRSKYAHLKIKVKGQQLSEDGDAAEKGSSDLQLFSSLQPLHVDPRTEKRPKGFVVPKLLQQMAPLEKPLELGELFGTKYGECYGEIKVSDYVAKSPSDEPNQFGEICYEPKKLQTAVPVSDQTPAKSISDDNTSPFGHVPSYFAHLKNLGLGSEIDSALSSLEGKDGHS